MGISDDIRVEKTKEPTPKRDIEIDEKQILNPEREILSDEFFKSGNDVGPVLKDNPIFARVSNFFKTLDKRYLFLLLIPICIIVILQNLSSLKDSFANNKANNNVNTSSDTIYDGEIIPQDYTVNNSNGTNTNAATVAPQTQSTPPASADTTPAGVDKSSIKIKLLNGNGVSGSAASVKNTLETAGYTISVTKNAANFNYANTVIYYKTGQEQAAELVKSTFTARTVTTELSDSITGSYTLVIVVGKN